MDKHELLDVIRSLARALIEIEALIPGVARQVQLMAMRVPTGPATTSKSCCQRKRSPKCRYAGSQRSDSLSPWKAS